MSKQPLTAIVAGATGLIGAQLVRLLLADPDYCKVVVWVRRELAIQSHPKLEQRIVAFDELESSVTEEDDTLEGAVVFCTLGTTIKKAGSQIAFRQVDYEYPLKLAQLAESRGASRFLIVTAMGADSQSRIFYNQVKGETEQSLQQLDLPALRIFRPSLLLGKREEFRLGERIAMVLTPLLVVVLQGPLAKYRPIAGVDVAKAMIISSKDPTPGCIVFESDWIAELAKAY